MSKPPVRKPNKGLWVPDIPKEVLSSEISRDSIMLSPKLEKEVLARESIVYMDKVLKQHSAPVITPAQAKLEQARLKLANIQKLKQHQEKEIATAEQKKEQFERDNKIEFFSHPGKGHLGSHGKWEPNKAQKELLNAFKSGNMRVFAYTGGNRSGKSFCWGLLVATLLDGKFPWEAENLRGWVWDMYGWKPPIRIRIVGQDYEKHIKTVVIPILKELLPKSWNMKVKKNTIGVEYFWIDPRTDSSVEIISNNSDSSVAEGWHGHAVFYDEPSSREMRVACARGLVDTNGIEGFFMTLLKEAWVDKEVLNRVNDKGEPDSSVIVVHSDTYANIGFGISQKGVEQFAKTLTDSEKEARLKGIPAYKAGLVLAIDRKKHVIKPFKVPSHWPVDVHIDIGVSKPHDIIYVATDPRNFKYICFEENLRGDGTMIADSIIKKQQRYNLRINRILCDPLAKADQNNENSTYDKIDMHLNRFTCPFTDNTYYLETGSKDKEDGIRRINDLLETVNGIPALFFFQDCGRSITQCENLMRDEKTGLVQKVDDDMFEGLYRIMLVDTQYEDIQRGKDNYYDERDSGTRSSTTGY